MPRTPDRHPGPLEEDEEIQLREPADNSPPSVAGAFRYVGGDFAFRDQYGTFNPRTGGSGITEEQHKTLRQLIHLADEGGPMEGFLSGAYRETLPAADPFPTSIIWWESSAKLKKIVEKTITRNANKTPATIEWKVYDAAGTLLVTLTDTIAYSGVFETHRTRTWA